MSDPADHPPHEFRHPGSKEPGCFRFGCSVAMKGLGARVAALARRRALTATATVKGFAIDGRATNVGRRTDEWQGKNGKCDSCNNGFQALNLFYS